MAGRPRGFDREAALLVAMERFWRNGYDETTVAELTRSMGITAPSLYAAFGDKDALFSEAAAYYFDRVATEMDRALDQPTAHAGISELVRISAAAYTDHANPPGCFLLSEPRLVRERRELSRHIAERIQRGIREGDVAPETDPGAMADFIIAVIEGLSTRARDGGSTTEVRAIADIALSTFAASAT
ncbi:TetR/AcrR family transcriptional regulator [Paramicrobacterium chengjingii]|uniref:TetR/AcrR family transcriptional regulator n=1 Tax=Paramicrobacterium chengjingii TaxID=2769067 RepID=UPI00142283DB|nr:TetR/AcrR family transcriptional regulator [Microbacterium chengjingii]